MGIGLFAATEFLTVLPGGTPPMLKQAVGVAGLTIAIFAAVDSNRKRRPRAIEG